MSHGPDQDRVYRRTATTKDETNGAPEGIGLCKVDGVEYRLVLETRCSYRVALPTRSAVTISHR
ncbi:MULTISPECIES: hypothetical protein [unclassified Mesorhizobium]|uniref:hypothetical protein n=1 Tax=unclassified Mesorhizobium TaxID=325217 RepID=UPI001CCFCF86|nr:MULTISPECIES: hypothetical protein [unclassified Mesorhizobium]MBZ9739978.1 hypothetical protein [Mesorhizobium sp. CO1-1-4]MBZ9806149.1 hypothetical protein [Mesorhizobium sp. ES1-6]